MANQLELLQKQNQALQQARAADANKLKQAALAIIALKEENHDIRQDMAQTQDLLFAILHSVGPKISISIDDYRNMMRSAQFEGDIQLDANGTYMANLTFYLEGKPETQTEEQNDGE